MLDRVTDSDSVGRWSESSRAHQKPPRNSSFGAFLTAMILAEKAIRTGVQLQIWRSGGISVVVKLAFKWKRDFSPDFLPAESFPPFVSNAKKQSRAQHDTSS